MPIISAFPAKEETPIRPITQSEYDALSDSEKNEDVVYIITDAKGDVKNVVFTPSVSSDGVLSWENNGGLDNPDPVSIKGVDGEPGADGADGKTAYQYAVDGGYTGTEEEFQAMMGTGPWLPIIDNVILEDIRIGTSARDGKLIIDGNVNNIITIVPEGSPPITKQSSSPVIIKGTYKGDGTSVSPFVPILEVSGRTVSLKNTLDMNGNRIKGIAYPSYTDDPTTKLYVDNSLNLLKKSLNTKIEDLKVNNCIQKIFFTIDGPIKAGETKKVSILTHDRNPFDKTSTILYFGPKAEYPYKPTNYSFKVETTELIIHMTSSTSGDSYNYENNMSIVALTDIPSGTTINMVLVWV